MENSESVVGTRGRKVQEGPEDEESEEQLKESDMSAAVSQGNETLDSSSQLLVRRKILNGLSITPNMRVILPKTHREITAGNMVSLTSLVQNWGIPKLFQYHPSMIKVIRHKSKDHPEIPEDANSSDASVASTSSDLAAQYKYKKLRQAKKQLKMKIAESSVELQQVKAEALEKTNLSFRLMSENYSLSTEVGSLHERVKRLQSISEHALDREATAKKELENQIIVATTLEKKLELEKLLSERREKAIENIKKQMSANKETLAEFQTALTVMRKDKDKSEAAMKLKLEDITKQLENERLSSGEKDKCIADMKKSLDGISQQLEGEKLTSSGKDKAISNLKRQLSFNKDTISELQKSMQAMQDAHEKSVVSFTEKIDEVKKQLEIERLNSTGKDVEVENMKTLLSSNRATVLELQSTVNCLLIEKDQSFGDMLRNAKEIKLITKECEDRLVSAETQHRMELRNHEITIAQLKFQLESGRQQMQRMNSIFHNTLSPGTSFGGNTGNPAGNVQQEAANLIQLSNSRSNMTTTGEQVTECLQEIMSIIGAPPEKTSSASTQRKETSSGEPNVPLE